MKRAIGNVLIDRNVLTCGSGHGYRIGDYSGCSRTRIVLAWEVHMSNASQLRAAGRGSRRQLDQRASRLVQSRVSWGAREVGAGFRAQLAALRLRGCLFDTRGGWLVAQTLEVCKQFDGKKVVGWLPAKTPPALSESYF